MENDETDDESEIIEVGPPPRKRRRWLIAGVVAAVLLAGGGGGAAFWWSGKDKPAVETETEPVDAATHQPVDVPPLLVNLRSPDDAPHFLKVHVMLVPGPKSDADKLKAEVPLLLDAYQPFLRELRPEDLAGSAAVYRIKEQLLIRARETLGDGHVKDVLVQDLIQQ